MQDFRSFYEQSYPRLRRILAAVTVDAADAEDALQEAYTRAAARWGRIARLDSPEAWVRRVALNLVTDGHRRRGRDRRHLPMPTALPGPSPDRTDLVAALRQLPLAQRQVLVLHHLLDRSVEDIARELDRPSGTVKAQLARGRAALQLLLTEEIEVIRHD